MLAKLPSVPWSTLVQPPDNHPDAVPRALPALAAAASPTDAELTYHAFVFAVGNNHAGTYFPAAVSTIPFLGEILESDRPWVRVATLDVLIDLLGCFEPDPAFRGPDGPAAIRNALFEAAQSLVPVLDGLTVAAGDRELVLVDELRELITKRAA